MLKIKKALAIITILFMIPSCVQSLKMKPEDFSSMEKGISALNVKLNYNNKNISLYPGDEGLNSCFIYFKDSESNHLKHKITKNYNRSKGNYIFIPNSNSSDIYLDSIHCLEYKVFYNKARVSTVKQRISSTSSNIKNKISYIGDVDINWISETFQTGDLLNLGAIGRDGGSFTMRIRDNYNNYLNFMESDYSINKGKSLNSVDKKLVGKALSRKK
jgi:hypothetical protein